MPSKAGGRRIIAFCLFLSAAALALSYVIDAKLEPLVVEIGESKVEYAAKTAMNNAVTELISSGEIDHQGIITFEKDDSGAITAVKSNVATINLLKSRITDSVLESIGDISVEEISVPVGSLTSLEYLSGRGPFIPVRIIAVRTLGVDFLNDFSTAGINQTIHRMYLCLDIEVTILAAGRRQGVETSSKYCIAETVIVGSVPESYTYFAEADSAKDAAENYFNFS